MLGGVIAPGHPLGNLYFTAWSHSLIAQSLNLAGDLKLGSYRELSLSSNELTTVKIPYRTMFLTQIWGTVFGAFINYVVMISIVNEHRDLLLNSNGNYAWSGASFQSLNNQATTWALASDLYTAAGRYYLVPIGLAIGFAAVLVHRIIVHVSLSIWISLISVCSPDSRTRSQGYQPAHPHRLFRSLGVPADSDITRLQYHRLRTVRSILPPKLPAPNLQRLLVLGHRGVGRRKFALYLHLVIRRVWRCRVSTSIPDLVG